jgi:hypothetical protein
MPCIAASWTPTARKRWGYCDEWKVPPPPSKQPALRRGSTGRFQGESPFGIAKPGKDDCDRFLLHLNQLLVNALGETVASTIVSRLHTVDGGDVCRVHVPPSRFPVEAHVVVDQGGQLQRGTAFYIRTGNATIEITKPAEHQKYLANRWCTTTSGRGASA